MLEEWEWDEGEIYRDLNYGQCPRISTYIYYILLFQTNKSYT
jgi:hypothetical protein